MRQDRRRIEMVDLSGHYQMCVMNFGYSTVKKKRRADYFVANSWRTTRLLLTGLFLTVVAEPQATVFGSLGRHDYRCTDVDYLPAAIDVVRQRTFFIFGVVVLVRAGGLGDVLHLYGRCWHGGHLTPLAAVAAHGTSSLFKSLLIQNHFLQKLTYSKNSPPVHRSFAVAILFYIVIQFFNRVQLTVSMVTWTSESRPNRL